MADDVKQSKPLRGGRQRANHIQVHRVELGLWERENFGKPMAEVMEEALAISQTVKMARTGAMVVAAGAAIGLTWTAYRAGQSFFGWLEDFEFPSINPFEPPEGAIKPDSTTEAVKEFLLGWFTGKGILWGRK